MATYRFYIQEDGTYNLIGMRRTKKSLERMYVAKQVSRGQIGDVVEECYAHVRANGPHSERVYVTSGKATSVED